MRHSSASPSSMGEGSDASTTSLPTRARDSWLLRGDLLIGLGTPECPARSGWERCGHRFCIDALVALHHHVPIVIAQDVVVTGLAHLARVSLVAKNLHHLLRYPQRVGRHQEMAPRFCVDALQGKRGGDAGKTVRHGLQQLV